MIKQTVPVTERALFQRINRKLSHDDQKLCVARHYGEATRTRTSGVTTLWILTGIWEINTHVDLEDLSRECCVMLDWETGDRGTVAMALFQPTYTDKKTGEKKTARFWWIDFSTGDKRVRESVQTTKKTIAEKQGPAHGSKDDKGTICLRQFTDMTPVPRALLL
jgi:hypothetical protein